MRNPAAFFAALRPAPFGNLSQSQVSGINALLAAMLSAGWPISFAAYGLATAAHETAKPIDGKLVRTMEPIKEVGGAEYFRKHYDITGNRTKALELGNDQPGDGPKYAGRGYVQLTGKANYAEAGGKLGVDLVNGPDRALEAEIAARIMIRGMSAGWFTGKALSSFLPSSGTATFEMFRRARRIVNGTDRDAEIAVIALQFQAALAKGGW